MTDADIIAMLKAHTLRPTQQRIAIYRYLSSHPCHPTAETIYSALRPILPSCSLMTVYNGLDALAQAGLIRVVTIEAGVKRFDATLASHGHFQCTRCKTVYDFPLTPNNMQVHSLDGFQILEQEYYCSGVCRGCLAKS